MLHGTEAPVLPKRRGARWGDWGSLSLRCESQGQCCMAVSFNHIQYQIEVYYYNEMIWYKVEIAIHLIYLVNIMLLIKNILGEVRKDGFASHDAVYTVPFNITLSMCHTHTHRGSIHNLIRDGLQRDILHAFCKYCWMLTYDRQYYVSHYSTWCAFLCAVPFFVAFKGFKMTMR